MDLVLLLGYLRKIGPATLSSFRGRILNIHPALLPDYGGPGMYGLNVHTAVLNAGETKSGASIHVVDGGYDTGPVIAQEVIDVKAGDVPETLAERVLQAEFNLLIKTLRDIEANNLELPNLLGDSNN